MTSILSEQFNEALVFAAQLHGTQTRKGSGVPYIAHLLGVASLVLEAGGTEEVAIAALLHDAIEDCGGAPTRDAIRQRFGDAVTAIVDGCTDSDTTPKPPWRPRKEAYIAHIPEASASVRLVSAADKLYNARSILRDYRVLGDRLWQRFCGGKEGTLWYYRAVLEALQQAGSNPLVEELQRVVQALDELVQQNEQGHEIG